MKILLDTADLKAIATINEKIGIHGVTTNPSILAKEEKNPIALLKLIKNIIGNKMLHVQVTESDSEKIIKEAKQLIEELGDNTYIKIPVTADGLCAMRELKKIGYKITATAVFTPLQALLAANEGADFVAPYINRIDKSGASGKKVVQDIVTIFKENGLKTQVLGASFKSTEQILECALVGMHACTLQADILMQMLTHPLTDAALEQFDNDWKALKEKLND